MGYLIKCVWIFDTVFANGRTNQRNLRKNNVKLIFIILFRQKYLSVQDRQELAAKLNLTGKPAKNRTCYWNYCFSAFSFFVSLAVFPSFHVLIGMLSLFKLFKVSYKCCFFLSFFSNVIYKYKAGLAEMSL